MTDSVNNQRRKMQRRHAMSPNSIEAIRLRGLCETLQFSGRDNAIDEPSSDSESFRFAICDSSKAVTYAAPSA